MKLALAFGAALFGMTLAGAPASALPLDRGVTAPAPIEQAAYGCGRGWAPDRWGRCRPMARAYRGPRVSVPRVLRDRPAPMWRQNLRERSSGCAYVRTPRGMRYTCR